MTLSSRTADDCKVTYIGLIFSIFIFTVVSVYEEANPVDLLMFFP